MIADFGDADNQDQLLELLRNSLKQPHVTPMFRAIAAGIANRYTGNRVPFFAMLLDDTRIMPDAGDTSIRYCDMAIAHLSAIVDERLINAGATPTPADWDQARQHAKNWLSTHATLMQARRAQRPTSATQVRVRSKQRLVRDSRRKCTTHLPQKTRKVTKKNSPNERTKWHRCVAYQRAWQRPLRHFFFVPFRASRGSDSYVPQGAVRRSV